MKIFLRLKKKFILLKTRQIKDFSGLVNIMPKYAIMLMIFTLGALGLPGTSGFIGEFLVLMGTFKKSILTATIASFGVILGAAYMLWLYKRIAFGDVLKTIDVNKMVDLNKHETIVLSSLAILVIFFGFFPDPLIKTYTVSIDNLINVFNSSTGLNLEENTR